MLKRSVPLFLLGLGVGLGLSFTFPKTQAEKHLTGLPAIERTGYHVVYDSRFKIPLYTYEKLTKESVNGIEDRKNCQFEADPSVYNFIKAF